MVDVCCLAIIWHLCGLEYFLLSTRLEWVSSKPDQNAVVLKHGVWLIASGGRAPLDQLSVACESGHCTVFNGYST